MRPIVRNGKIAVRNNAPAMSAMTIVSDSGVGNCRSAAAAPPSGTSAAATRRPSSGRQAARMVSVRVATGNQPGESRQCQKEHCTEPCGSEAQEERAEAQESCLIRYHAILYHPNSPGVLSLCCFPPRTDRVLLSSVARSSAVRTVDAARDRFRPADARASHSIVAPRRAPAVRRSYHPAPSAGGPG